MLLVDFVRLISVAVVFDQAGETECHIVSPIVCDFSKYTGLKEGNNGVTSDIPWLGLLRVHIPQEDTSIIALTGIVLVKQSFAIANADDVARIPRNIFRYNSNAMFIPKTGQAWFCSVLDYMTHPEFEDSKLNTIALVELHLGLKDYPIKPICLPLNSFNTNTQLYAFEFVDDNKILEKYVYSIKHVDTRKCHEHYKKIGLTEENLKPVHYQCGYARKSHRNCVWENGLTLASNSSGHWTLIGFGIRGPGCRATARFISLLPYVQWIHSNTSPDNDGTRKSALHEGFRTNLLDDKIVPLAPPIMDEKYNQAFYEFDIDRHFSIDKIAENAVDIRNFAIPGEDGNCSDPNNKLIFSDSTNVVHQSQGGGHSSGSVSYRLSMYDLYFLNYTCVRVDLISIDRSPATIYWSASIDKEGPSLTEFGETPESMIREYPMPSLKFDHKTNDEFSINYLKDPSMKIKMQNWNIYFKLDFEHQGVLRVKIYGPNTDSETRRSTNRNPTTTYIPINTDPTTKKYFKRRIDNLELNKDAITQNPYKKITKDVIKSKTGRAKVDHSKSEHIFEKGHNTRVDLNSTASVNGVFVNVSVCILIFVLVFDDER